MVYLIFDKSANPTPTLGQTGYICPGLREEFSQRFLQVFSNLLEERGISDCFLQWTCPQKEGVGVGAEN